MADESSEQQRKKRKAKKRNAKWSKSYTKFTIRDAEKKSKALGEDAIDEIKQRVYDNLIDYIDAEDYPSDAMANFNEANINDLVYATIVPIIPGFRRKTCRKSLQLQKEREIIAVGSESEAEAGGVEEFVVVDLISVKEDRFVIIIEAKRPSVGQAMKQCLLSMFNMRGNNGSGKVFGFITTGESWRMVSFDGTLFQLTYKFDVMFEGMRNEYEKWKKEFSLVVDCMVLALSDGGIVNTEAKNDQKFSTLASTPQQIRSNSGHRPAETNTAAAAATILRNLANTNKTATKQTDTNFVPLKAYFPQDVLPWGRAMPAANATNIKYTHSPIVQRGGGRGRRRTPPPHPTPPPLPLLPPYRCVQILPRPGVPDKLPALLVVVGAVKGYVIAVLRGVIAVRPGRRVDFPDEVEPVVLWAPVGAQPGVGGQGVPVP
ncbi:hypothetical protein EV426DRAFT_676743 [Tirmania nivea]|nr:hypothetical protein EV426DRAFT_676743 [Tirmania nivea]